jgi:hypothetical protein
MIIVPAGAMENGDISGHWAETRLNNWKDNGWIDQINNLDNKVTHEEFAIVVRNRLEVEIPSSTKQLTRLDAALAVYDILIELGYVDDMIGNDLAEFDDSGSLALEVKQKISMTVSKGIIKGYSDKTLRLKNIITKAESLVIIDRILNLEAETPELIIGNSEAYITSEKYSVSDRFIKNIDFGTSLETFKSNIEPNEGATYEIYKYDETTLVTRISEGYKVIVTSEDKSATKTYRVDILPNPNKKDRVSMTIIGTDLGSGTVEDPYKIYYLEDLASIGTTNAAIDLFYGLDDYYTLMNNLDFDSNSSYRDANGTSFGDLNSDGSTDTAIIEFTEGVGWMPISDPDYYTKELEEQSEYHMFFSGSFNGNNKTISNLYIDREIFVGLFGAIVDDGEVKNLNLKNINLSSTGYVGGLAGATANREFDYEPVRGYEEAVKIDNCSVSGKIKGDINIGGLIGFNIGGIISNSFSDVDISILGRMDVDGFDANGVGGLLGFSWGKVYNCYASGDISGTINTGGLIGGVLFSEISNSYATGNVTVVGNTLFSRAGGLIGITEESIISYSYSTGNVSSGAIGGVFVGESHSTEFDSNMAFSKLLTYGSIQDDLIFGEGRYIEKEKYNTYTDNYFYSEILVNGDTISAPLDAHFTNATATDKFEQFSEMIDPAIWQIEGQFRPTLKNVGNDEGSIR